MIDLTNDVKYLRKDKPETVPAFKFQDDCDRSDGNFEGVTFVADFGDIDAWGLS